MKLASLLLLAALLAAGCGRSGDLYLPPNADEKPRQESDGQ